MFGYILVKIPVGLSVHVTRCTSHNVRDVMYMMWCTWCDVRDVMYVMWCTWCDVCGMMYVVWCTTRLYPASWAQSVILLHTCVSIGVILPHSCHVCRRLHEIFESEFPSGLKSASGSELNCNFSPSVLWLCYNSHHAWPFKVGGHAQKA